MMMNLKEILQIFEKAPIKVKRWDFLQGYELLCSAGKLTTKICEEAVIDMDDKPEKKKEIRTPFKDFSWIFRVESNKGVQQRQYVEGKIYSSLLLYEIKGICLDTDDIY